MKILNDANTWSLVETRMDAFWFMCDNKAMFMVDNVRIFCIMTSMLDRAFDNTDSSWHDKMMWDCISEQPNPPVTAWLL